MFGQGASTNGFDLAPKCFDYKQRQFEKNRPEWEPAWTSSLKGQIHHLTGIEPSKLLLYYRGTMMGNDELTLRSAGICEGDRLRVRFQKCKPIEPGPGRDLVLACTAKKEITQRRRDDDAASGKVHLNGYSLKQSKHFSRCCTSGGTVQMTAKWIISNTPALCRKAETSGVNSFQHSAIYLADFHDGPMKSIRKRIDEL